MVRAAARDTKLKDSTLTLMGNIYSRKRDELRRANPSEMLRKKSAGGSRIHYLRMAREIGYSTAFSRLAALISSDGWRALRRRIGTSGIT